MGETGCQEGGNQRPECIELPHVTEVSKGLVAKGPAAEDLKDHARIEKPRYDTHDT